MYLTVKGISPSQEIKRIKEMTDLTYTQNEFWTRFIPHTDAGIDAFRVIANADKDGECVVLNMHKDAVLKQMRNAGLVVKKAKKPTRTEYNAMLDDEILNELFGG